MMKGICLLIMLATVHAGKHAGGETTQVADDFMLVTAAPTSFAPTTAPTEEPTKYPTMNPTSEPTKNCCLEKVTPCNDGSHGCDPATTVCNIIDITGPRSVDWEKGSVYLPGKDQLGQRASSFVCTCLAGLVLDPQNVAACISSEFQINGKQVIKPEAGIVYVNQNSNKQPVDPANFPEEEWEAREAAAKETGAGDKAVPTKERERERESEIEDNETKQKVPTATAAAKSAAKALSGGEAQDKVLKAAFNNPVNSEKVAQAVAEIHEEAPVGVAWSLKADSEEVSTSEKQKVVQSHLFASAAVVSAMLVGAVLVVVRRRLIARRTSDIGQWEVTRTATTEVGEAGSGVAPGIGGLAVI
jgi:hypothetical protein